MIWPLVILISNFSADQLSSLALQLKTLVQIRSHRFTTHVLSSFPSMGDPLMVFQHTWKNWQKQTQTLETAYYQGHLQTVIDTASVIEQRHPWLPKSLRLHPTLKETWLKVLGFKSLSYRALNESSAYEKTCQRIATQFTPADVSPQWFPEDFVTTLKKMMQTQQASSSELSRDLASDDSGPQWISWPLPLDAQVITPSLREHTHLQSPLQETLAALNQDFPEPEVWFLHHLENDSILFCHRYRQNPQWQCLSHALHPHTLAATLPTLLSLHRQYQPAPKLLPNFQPAADVSPSSLTSSPSLSSPSGLTALPWWVWAGSVVLVSGATVYFLNSSGSDNPSPQQPIGTLQWP